MRKFTLSARKIQTLSLTFLMLFLMNPFRASADYSLSFGIIGTDDLPDSVVVKNLHLLSRITVPGGEGLDLTTFTAMENVKSDNNVLSVYPVPMNEKAYVAFNNTAAGNVNIAVYDMTGKTVLQNSAQYEAGNVTCTLSGLRCGNYIVSVQTNGRELTSKFTSISFVNNPTISNGNFFVENSVMSKAKSAVAVNNYQLPYQSGDSLIMIAYKAGKISAVIKKTVTASESVLFDAFATNVFVKANGTGDGTSWGKATTLSAALQMTLADGDIIHIAEGTYIPENNVSVKASDSDVKYKTFEISKNIKLQAGYAAGVTDALTEAQSTSYETILSGQLDESTRARRVVTIGAPIAANQSVVLDGLTIKDGYANYISTLAINGITIYDSYGTGAAIMGSNVVLNNCVIKNNGGKSYGSLSVYSAVLQMNNCQVIDNNEDTSNTGYGRGIYAVSSNVTVNGCTFSGNINYAGQSGAFYAESSTVKLYNSTFANNQSGTYCAGVYIKSGTSIASTAIIVNCTFYGNQLIGATKQDYYPTSLLVHSTSGAVSSANIVSSTFANGSGSNYEVAWYTATTVMKFYNSMITASTMGTYRPNTTTPANYSFNKMVLSGSVYDASGAAISAVTFTANTMLGSLANNGGNTQTCALTGANNPAETYGMTLSEIEAVCTPLGVPVTVYSNDQKGVSRVGKTTMGAVVNN